MSYEGYTQYLCPNGHLWTVDAYLGDGDNEHICSQCRQTRVWSHSVDCTNGIVYDEDGKELPDTVPFELEVDHYEERVIKVPIYKVPTA